MVRRSILFLVRHFFLCVVHLIAQFGTFFFHFADRSVCGAVFIEIADRFISKIFGFFDDIVSLLICFAQDLVTACV